MPVTSLTLNRPSNIQSFFKRTKRGSVIKIVREHYLRNNIPCGLQACGECGFPANEVYLSNNPRFGIHKVIERPHILILDSPVVFNQMDVLEDETFGSNVVILQTVRNEIRSKNLSLYSRIKNIPRQRNFYVFMNEFHQDVYSDRRADEKLSDYNFRLVLKAAQWYSKHLKKSNLDIILIVSDDDSKKKAVSAGIISFTLMEYVEKFRENTNLLDKVVKEEEKMEIDQPHQKLIFPDHFPLHQLQSGIKNGTIFQAKYETNRDNYLEGSVTINLKGEATRVLIVGREKINRAVHEDIVAVELLPESEWRGKSGIVLTADDEVEERDPENIENPTEDLEEEESLADSKKPTGRVVGIIRRNWRQYCGILRERSANIIENMVITSHFFVPFEKRIPFIRIETRQYETLKNQRIIVAIDSWPRDSKYPKGHYVRALGPIGDKATESELLLLEHDVPHDTFSKAVMKCLPDPGSWSISESELEKRLDLRDKPICSVDPPGCTDIDDALHCLDLGEGTYEVGVHIADVSHFVKPNSALDLEAANRGTTVYLVDNRIDMIPSVLSSNLCSLIGQKERYTFSVIWKIDSQTAEVRETSFHKSIICSRAAMTYAEAQLKIDSQDMTDEVSQGLRRLNNLAKKLRKKRMDRGALVLANLGEIKFVEIDSETHDNVTRIESKQLLETNSMVEEFMLLANISVAEKLYQELPQLALLRCHPKPNPVNFDELMSAAKSRGFEVDTKDGRSLADSLDKLKDPSNPFFNLMFRMITTRCMTQAYYFCSGKVSDPESFLHFGLATPIYTHFTSPIRRYADLIVHRLLSHIIGNTNLDSTFTNCERISHLCENINYRHRQAQYASRASIKLHTIVYIKSSKKPLEDDGYILFVRKNALQILIPRLAFETTYFLKPLKNWTHDPIKMLVTHIPTNISIKQFDAVKVRLSLNQGNQIRKGFESINVEFINPMIPLEIEM